MTFVLLVHLIIANNNNNNNNRKISALAIVGSTSLLAIDRAGPLG